jgi:hypothetical protein
LLLAAGLAQAADSGPRAVFGTNLIARLAAYKAGRAHLVPKGEGQPFEHAFLSSVAAATPHPWDVQMIAKSTDAVSAGETLALVFAIRDAAGGGHMGVKLMNKAGQTLLRQEIKPDGTWRKVMFTAKVGADCAAGELTLILFFGQQRQESMVAEVSVLAFAPGSTPVVPAELTSLPEIARARPAAASDSTVPVAPARPSVMPTLPPLDTTRPRFVVLKFDDMQGIENRKTPVHSRFQRLADYIEGKNLKASFGIIAKSLEVDNPGYYAWIRQRALENGGHFEFWFHGYDHAMDMDVAGTHCKAEFSGPPYAYQSEHFAQGCKLMKQRVGFPFRSFGAPGNAVDATGVRVLEENPEIRVWLFGPAQIKSSKFIISRSPELEYAVGKVSFEAFVKGYQPKRSQICVALQGHPTHWDEAMFVEFQHIVEVLQADGRIFLTPYEYYQLSIRAGEKR